MLWRSRSSRSCPDRLITMLERLEVRHLALLDEVVVEFGPGLSVLTGETGAGKSLLVEALGLLLGGSAQGLQGPGGALLVTAWIDGRSFSRRVQSGRSAARLEGEVVSMAELIAELEGRLALYTQHAALGLIGRRSQRAILDALLPPQVLADYREAYERWKELQSQYERLRQEARRREERMDALRFQISEIRSARLDPQEPERLDEELRRLRHAEVLRERVHEALEGLSGEYGALIGLAQAERGLRAALRYDERLAPFLSELEASQATLQALVREFEDYLEALDADPQKLEALEARRALLDRLDRKYGPGILEVLAHAARAEAELASLIGLEDRLEALAHELEEAIWKRDQTAQALRRHREAVAQQLAPQVEEEIRGLGIPEGRFGVRLLPLETPSLEGTEEVEFLFASSPKLPLTPLDRSASGGELSRVMLALALLTGAEAQTVVFDEIDAGLGGEATWEVALRLARLARHRQVFVVTHLAQIAAQADQHYRVVKDAQGIRVERVEGEARVFELARMLSGNYSEAALEHARELLRLGQQPVDSVSHVLNRQGRQEES